jgi:thioredoxin-dependent peroxiredoxin
MKMMRRLWSLVLLMVMVACYSQAKRPDGGEGLLPVGSKAPNITALDAGDHPSKLDDMRGHPVLVYFYPGDETPGCTKEACALRDSYKKYEAAGVKIIGVSSNSADSHRAFIKNHALPFPLAADEDGSIGKSYGVRKAVFGYERVSFLVGSDGTITKVWPDVDPVIHATEVLAVAAPDAGS